MIQKIKKEKALIEIGFLIGVVTFLFTLLTTTLWQNDGISMGETIMLPLIGGFYLFLSIIIVNIVGINKVRKLAIKNNEQPIKKIYQVLIVLFISIFAYTLFDSIYFLFDNSLSKDYASSLEALLQSSGEKTDDIKDFEKLPFSVQNIFSSIFSAIVAGLITLPFIKADGEIFKSKNDNYYR
ncbi:hypothetical protein [Flavobacterium sp.]|jgi:hypothetical protein|uniref:hypothetical protein n=1 Tax=Flavobacterium sp. TaxID=239 RepID=UPI0037C00F0D